MRLFKQLAVITKRLQPLFVCFHILLYKLYQRLWFLTI